MEKVIYNSPKNGIGFTCHSIFISLPFNFKSPFGFIFGSNMPLVWWALADESSRADLPADYDGIFPRLHFTVIFSYLNSTDSIQLGSLPTSYLFKNFSSPVSSLIACIDIYPDSCPAAITNLPLGSMLIPRGIFSVS